jgi:hypothetical protein
MFIILHLVCVLFGFVGLIITIPLHIIYSVLKKGKKERPELSERITKVANDINASRPKDVRDGKRAMTFAEGWDEMKRFKTAYVKTFLVMTGMVVGFLYFINA